MALRELYNKHIDYSGHYYPLIKYGTTIYGGSMNGELVRTTRERFDGEFIINKLPSNSMVSCIHFGNNGVMLIGNYDGEIYRSVSPYTNFTKVLDFIGTGAWALSWSFASNGDTLFLSEYGLKGSDPNANGRHVYISRDNGLTWVNCWTNPYEQYSHIHKILYDTTDGSLYVATGDGKPYTNLYKLSPPNYDNSTSVVIKDIQPTGGLCFNGYNLWAQDGGDLGIYKQLKPTDDPETDFVWSLDFKDYPGLYDTIFDALKHYTTADGTRAYCASYPSVFATTEKVGFFKGKAPFDKADWKLLATLDEFTKEGTESVGVRHFIRVDDDEAFGEFDWMPSNPYGIRRQVAIRFTDYKKDLRP